MRTRIFSTPSNGTPSAYWQADNATTGQTGALLPFATPGGQAAGTGGTLEGPGSFISAQFSLAAAPASLYVALDTNGPASGVIINLESYADFSWTVLNSANLADASSAPVNLPAANLLGLVRLRVSIGSRASAQCVAILNTTSTATPGGGSAPTTTTSSGDWEYRKDLTGAIGGTATDLDSVPTANLTFGHVVAFNFAGQLAAYRYEDPNDPTTPVLSSQPTGPGSNGTSSRFRSLDHGRAGNSNNGVWVRIL